MNTHTHIHSHKQSVVKKQVLAADRVCLNERVKWQHRGASDKLALITADVHSGTVN